jgi:hypothetical protein
MEEQPGCEVGTHGTKYWLLHGKYHREDGPAVETKDGYRAWYLNDKLHREDGPAIEYPDGHKHWSLHGEKVRPEQVVDYHLMRGTFCYYDEQSNELKFNA